MKNNIIIEKGKTIINDKSAKKATAERVSNDMILNQMQQNYDNLQNPQSNANNAGFVSAQGIDNTNMNNSSNTLPFQNNFMQNNGGINLQNLASILPLIKNMGSSKSNDSLMNLIQTLGQNGGQNSVLSSLLPLISSLNTSTKKVSKKSIDSLEKIEDEKE